MIKFFLFFFYFLFHFSTIIKRVFQNTGGAMGPLDPLGSACGCGQGGGGGG